MSFEGLASVRPDERFDLIELAAYLRAHGLPVSDGLEVAQFTSGHSNLTYLLKDGEQEWVLRRPPLGPVAPKAHDMERESRILTLLHPVFPLAPKPYLFCGDDSVIGAPFYLMERRHGLVLDRKWPAGLERSPERCRAISLAVVDTLAQLHQVDYRSANLAAMGRPEGYLQRQVEGWIGRYERAKTSEIDAVGPLCRWLVERLPASPAPTIVHNDYKLNNVMLDQADPSRVTAILDWEMATVGDPLADLGGLLGYWSEPGDEAELGALASVTALPGFLSRREVLQRYAEKSGRDVSQINYYLAFAYFKIAVICQQIYYRWVKGQTQDERFRHLGQVAESMIRRAERVTRTPEL